jgi:hypothetical protein
MSEQTFNIVFAGELVGGADPARVRENLARLFKMDAARVEALFSGKPVVIKKGADQATAMKFRAALRQAGAQCQMVPVGGEPQAADPASANTLAPAPANAGKAVFGARDPTPPAPAEPEADQVEPAQAQDNVTEIEAAPPPAPAPIEAPAPAASASPGELETVGTIRTSGTGFSGEFDVAPVGADMEEKRDGPPPVNPDISHLSMAPPGTELEEIREKKEPVSPDISHLSVAPDPDH